MMKIERNREMREILFRGKRCDSGEWAEGYLMDENYINTPFNDDDAGGRFDEPIEVDPETVCQYTGLTDRNGRKIFEGDILCNHYDDVFPETATMSVIVWDISKWGQKDRGYLDELNEHDCKNGEVAGNIFDNPDLVQKQGKRGV